MSRLAERVLLTGALLMTLTACGYRFPGESQTKITGDLKLTTVKVAGRGAQDNPLLAREMQERLDASLGTAAKADVGSNGLEKSLLENGAMLQLELRPVSRTLQTETNQGRAEQYRVTMEAKPLVKKGNELLTEYPVIKGESTYYEQRTSTENQAIRIQAETEAMEQLVDNLSAILKEER